MSFGIGIGDIALVTRVGFKLWLNVSGAEKEREDLTADLMNWRDRLEIVKLRLSDAQLLPRDASLARSQLSEALANLKLLEEMNRKLVKGRVFRRAAWEVCGREHFDKYRSDLEKCVAMIDSLFLCGSTAIVSRTTQENHAISRENNVILRGLEMRMRPFNLTPVSTQVRFIDALNRERLIPFEWCLTMEKFRAIVQINFDGSAGSSFVQKGEYDLINEESGALIKAEEWNKTIKPGLLLSMAIVVRKLEQEGANDPSCPACKRQFIGYIGSGNFLGRINCGYCGRWCQISPEIRASKPNLFEELIGIGSSNSSHGRSEDDELIHIQRFHVRVTEISDTELQALACALEDAEFARSEEAHQAWEEMEEEEEWEQEVWDTLHSRVVELSDDE